MEELKKTLECPICGVEKQFLGIHLRRIHGILPDEAKECFGLESLTAPALLASRTGSNNSFFGKHHSDVSKEQMIMKRDGKHFGIPMPTCKVCGKSLQVRGAEYCREHCGIKMSGDKNAAKRPDVRKKISEGLSKVKEQRAANISKGKKGKARPDMKGDLNFAKRPEVRKKLSENCSMKRKEVRIKAIRSGKASPNFPESYLFNLICSLFPNQYALNPKGEIMRIGNKMPDIININGQKKVIEHFGELWHKPEDEEIRINHFKKFGFECLVIWNREFKDLETLKQRIIEFHNQKRFNEHNQNISNEMVVCSGLQGDLKRLAEMTSPVLMENQHE